MSDNDWIRPEQSILQGAAPINEEVDWDKSQVIISETDKFGTITNVNETFVQVSGYTATELIGQPHNIIRHPDMPKIIFKALWVNLEQGSNFMGIVKNKAKSGRYYWVITDFEIIKDDEGNTHRYIARRKSVPKATIKNHIEPLYESLLKLESIGGMELSNRYFKNFLKKQDKNYLDYIMEIMGENESKVTKISDFKMDSSVNIEGVEEKTVVTDNSVYTVDEENETKRKSFFSRLFS